MKMKRCLAIALAACMVFAAEAAKKYKVTIVQPANGTITLTANGSKLKSGTLVAPNTKITVTTKPKTGYALQWTYVEAGATLSFSKPKFTFKMQAENVTVKADLVSKAQEQAGLDSFAATAADNLLSSDVEGLDKMTRGGKQWWVGGVGDYLCMDFNGWDDLHTDTTFSAVGLPSGLKLVKTGPYAFSVEGVPTGVLDPDVPAFITAKGAGGSKAMFRLPLKVRSFNEMEYLGDERRIEYLLKVGDTLSIGTENVNWSGFKPLKPPKGFTWSPSDRNGSFKATEADVVNVSLVRARYGLGGTYNERRWIRFYVVPADSPYFPSIPESIPGVLAGNSMSLDVKGWFSGGSNPKITGLPSGLKFDAKKKKISGIPTKTGTFVLTVQKTVTSKVRKTQVFLMVEPVPFTANFILSNSYGARHEMDGWETANVVYTPAGLSSGISFNDVPSNAKVTASGLPAGVKLVFDKSNGLVKFSGRAKPGTHVMTVKIVANGTTQTFRYKVVVVPSAAQGGYRGFVLTTGIGEGPLTATIDSMNKATFTIVEGSSKTKVSAYPMSGYPQWTSGVQNSKEGYVEYQIWLPANTKLKLGKRQFTFSVKVDNVGRRETYVLIEPDPKGRGYSNEIACDPVESRAKLNADYPLLWVSPAYRWAVHETDGFAYLGSSCYASAEVDTSTAKATISVRLPRGKAHTLKDVPIVVPDPKDSYSAHFAPQVLTDSDGSRYLLVLPLEPDKFNGAPTGQIRKVKRGMEVFGCFRDFMEVGTPEATVTEFVHFTPKLQMSFGASSPGVGYTMDFTANPKKPKVDGTVVKSFSYSTKTGITTFSFVKSGYTYTVYMVQDKDDDTSPFAYFNGIVKRVKGTKTSWGTAVLLEGPAG